LRRWDLKKKHCHVNKINYNSWQWEREKYIVLSMSQDRKEFSLQRNYVFSQTALKKFSQITVIKHATYREG